MEHYQITTDETLRETVQHGDSSYPFAYYPENIWQFDFHRIDWHWHYELEFVYVAEGTATCLAGTDKIELKEGFGIFINSGILHRFEAQCSTFIPNIVFSPTLLAPEKSLIFEKYVAPVINAAVPYQIFAPHIAWQTDVLKMMQRIFALQETGKNNELRTAQYLLQLWDILWNQLDLTFGSANLRRFNHKQARLQTMMQYIHDHYAEEITLEMIADSASISKSGALHIFQSVPAGTGCRAAWHDAKIRFPYRGRNGFYKHRIFLPEIQAALPHEPERLSAQEAGTDRGSRHGINLS